MLTTFLLFVFISFHGIELFAHSVQITGGIGRDRLTDFYRHHFIFNNPKDTKMELISRTVGIDRVVDEFIMTFTHDSEVDWM